MKEQIIIDGVREGCEILFECGSVEDLASYDMIKKNIKITPENAPVDDYDIRLIANPHSPYGFSSIFKRNKNVDEWEYMGFGHSGACSVVTALLKQLARKISECEELKERIKCNCFDPKSNNNRCISYNRIAEDYEKDLKHLKNKIAECEKYEQLFDELDKRVSNCIEIYDCIIVSKIVKDIIIKAKGEGNE